MFKTNIKQFSLLLLLCVFSMQSMNYRPTFAITKAVGQSLELLNSEYEKRINASLVGLAIKSSKEKASIAMLDSFIAYHQQSSYPRNLNEIYKKLIARWTLSYQLNQEIYMPALAAFTPEERENPDDALQEFDAVKEEVWNREWPLVSVDCELEIIASKISALRKKVECEKQKLTLVEQQSLDAFDKDLDKQIKAIDEARKTIQNRVLIYKDKANAAIQNLDGKSGKTTRRLKWSDEQQTRE